MEYDVVIVGGGPAGLSTAIRLRQLAAESGQEISVCLLEKGSEIGAHILSGAVVESRALDELLPSWKEDGAPLNVSVARDEVYLFTNERKSVKLPNFMIPPSMHNEGNYIVSLGNVVRWLGEQAEAMEVEVYPGFPAAEILYHEDGSVKGVATPDMGLDQNGEKKDSYEPGMELHAKYTVFAEGCRGQLGKELLNKFNLDADADPQHYGIGLKELWEVKPENHQEGLVVHSSGWPLEDATGGSFLYHMENNQVVLGLIVDLNYSNPHLSPFDEFQRMKHHPVFAKVLEGGSRISYGARAITKGGLNALPKMSMPGGLLLGCDAGTLNFAKIKGTHTAMKSGMIAAEVLFEQLKDDGEGSLDLTQFDQAFLDSWAGQELRESRNFGPAMHKYGLMLGGAFNYLDQKLFKGNAPFTLRDKHFDYAMMKPAAECRSIEYPKPDGKLSFDKLSSVFLTNTFHEENQPCHLKLTDTTVPITKNLAIYDAPEQRYCPAGVYEIVEENGQPELQINGQNCIHCKTCDIKDPSQNITWVAPEGGGGPSYPNM
ncbi:MAG: electron transfer flavoprotein-ubiquinone oxidoreductase [Proteobacteria bacterium]|nr:MAG: electron transfer flavoprotein-ubiquinone oxidoreductase [Pseudomonadota bacterium]